MKTLLIMRHAKSSWKFASLSDHDRPLNERGERDAPLMGKLLNEQGFVPDLILTSTAMRASETARLVAENCSFDGEIKKDRNLYHAGVDEFIDGLKSHPDDEDTVMVVGHNPGIAELVDYLTDSPESMTTANIAVIRLAIDSWGDLDFETEGELVNVFRPRDL
jgi:phosphohistidine phosphatase